MEYRVASFGLFIISLVAVVLLYFQFAENIVKRKNALTVISILVPYGALVILIGIYAEKYFIFVFIPFIFLLNVFLLRYALFNKLTQRWFLHELNYPYDPVVLFPGMFFAYWDKTKRVKISASEVFFSYCIFLLPLLELLVIGSVIK